MLAAFGNHGHGPLIVFGDRSGQFRMAVGTEPYLFGLLALHEGNQQATVLSRMDTRTAATAAAMNEAKTSLKSLAEQQAKSLESLTKMTRICTPRSARRTTNLAF
jgi:hypothetical protein